LYIIKAINTFNLARGYESLYDALSRIESKVNLISFKGDMLFFPQEMEHIANMLERLNKNYSYNCIDSNYGHDAFLVEIDKFDFLIRQMLEEIE